MQILINSFDLIILNKNNIFHTDLSAIYILDAHDGCN
jgi:hypothetical protein